MPKASKLFRTIGTAIREQRKHVGFSQEDLAEKAGLARNYIGEVERAEKKISLEALEKIAKALGIRLRDFLDDV